MATILMESRRSIGLLAAGILINSYKDVRQLRVKTPENALYRCTKYHSGSLWPPLGCLWDCWGSGAKLEHPTGTRAEEFTAPD